MNFTQQILLCNLLGWDFKQINYSTKEIIQAQKQLDKELRLWGLAHA